MIKAFLKKNWFIFLFALILIYPLYGGLTDSRITLKGVAKEQEAVPLTPASLGDGSWQSSVNAVFEESFPGRSLLIRLRNQMLYTMGISPNTNVVIGRSGCLFEPADILFDQAYYPPCDETYFDTLGQNLEKLNALLASHNKELYVFITPYKPRYFRDWFPDRLKPLDNRYYYGTSNYDRLVKELDDHGILYYDSIPMIDRGLEDGVLASGVPAPSAPVFCMTGKHWTQPWAACAAGELLEFIRAHSRFDLGSIQNREIPQAEPVYPDADLYDTLNLISRPEGPWYDAETSLSKEGADHPGFFARGGSFMGQSVNRLILSGVFGTAAHFENMGLHTDRYFNSVYMSDFYAYDELDLKPWLSEADILLLEINEGTIDRMSWGFIEYLLEHPEYLKKDT